ncbi:SGNH/GDSL hydrolase family protein [Lacisediminihabitans profunda]|uniref:SGNH/GDSL hydrolase family protein n=1 Tax=Lacisediminihabitans profunda TaxID=2594790 RepID=A0A5C8UPZ3_9MICO|nr:SGNH/GDSL hydrolase family protein [Lacisediminihabitans profunda]TXN30364.1 SGNH/GDSL hydrolase family protein [Lacisediminihabitans profunda]
MTTPLLLTLIAVAVLVALAATVAWALGRLRHRAGSARLANTLHLNARWWKDEGKKHGDLLYVALGDSAAQGVGASKPGRSYVGLIARHLRERTGRTVRVVNLSMSGARLREALAIQLPALRRMTTRPDVLTVAIGANDIASFDPLRFESELRELYAALPAGAIVADLPSFYLGSSERKAREANAIVRRLAAERDFEVAPLHAATRRQGAARYALNQVAADFFHPNDRGYRVWASAFLPLLDRVVAETRSTADTE